MKELRSCGILTKVIAYTLILSINMLYIPFGSLTRAYAADKTVRVYLLGFAPDGQKTPLEIQGMLEDKFKDGLGKNAQISFISSKEAQSSLKSEMRAPATKGVEGDKKDLKRLKKALDSTKEALADGENEDLYKYGDKAVKAARGAANLIEDFADVKDAYLYLALGAAATDKKDDAKQALATVLAFDPEFKPSSDHKALKSIFGDVSKAAKKGKLNLTSDPANAKISINGKAYTSPVKESKLGNGVYFVKITADNMKPYGEIVEINNDEKTLDVVLGAAEGVPAQLDKAAVLKEVNEKARAANYDQTFFTKAQQVGKWLSADYLVLGQYKSESDSSTFTPMVFDVTLAKLGQVKTVTVSHKLDEAEDGIDSAFKATRKAILKSFPEKQITPAGGVVVAAAPAKASDDDGAFADDEPKAKKAEPTKNAGLVDEEEAAPAKAAEPEPEPVKVAEPLNLDVDKSLFLATSDAAKASEDSEGEEFIAPVEPPPFYKQWWFWTIIGVVVAGGVASLVAVDQTIGLTPDDHSRPSHLVLPTNK